VPRLAGCFTLVFFYLFVRLIFSVRVALLSTFLMAVSKWHIIHSRYGVRAGQFTLFEVAALYFLARGFLSERKNTEYFLLAGLFTGLGFHTYLAFRIFPLVIVAFVISGQFLRQLCFRWKGLLFGGLLCLIILAPLAIYYVNNQASFSDRMNRTLVWRQARAKYENPVVLTAQSVLRTSWLFTYQGDAIARHNVNSEPMLSPYASAFFLLGLLVALANIRKRYFLFTLLWLALNLVLGVVTVGAPHAARTLGAIPPTMILTAIGVLAALQILSPWGRIISTAILAVILGGNFYTGINDALLRFPLCLDGLPAAISSLWGMDRDQANVASLINRLGPKCEVYLSPQYFFHSTVEYLTYSKQPTK
jgi:4-amino-4-deoxy-L-arabinose transferase-like glycosyltransferase